jgi:hypothetical protein
MRRVSNADSAGTQLSTERTKEPVGTALRGKVCPAWYYGHYPTWDSAPSSWATPFDLTSPDSFQGIIPILTFDGSNDEADTPDTSYFTRGDSSDDSPFTIIAYLNLTASASAKSILAKFSSGAREWGLVFTNAEKLYAIFFDESSDDNVTRLADNATTVGVMNQVAMTYAGTGGGSAMNGVTFFENGESIASTPASSGYVAMQDEGGVIELGSKTQGEFFKGSMAGGPAGIAFSQILLSPDAIRRDFQLMRKALGV